MSDIKQEYLTTVRDILNNLERDSFYDIIDSCREEVEREISNPEKEDLKIMKKLLKEIKDAKKD